jgi:hypothetical protein
MPSRSFGEDSSREEDDRGDDAESGDRCKNIDHGAIARGVSGDADSSNPINVCPEHGIVVHGPLFADGLPTCDMCLRAGLMRLLGNDDTTQS